MNYTSKIMAVLILSAILILAGCTTAQPQPKAHVGAVDSASASPAEPARQVETATQEVSLNAAPSFVVQTTEGRSIDTEAYKEEGKGLVVYFMASTCSTCAKNWENINEVYPELKGKVDLIAISVDPTDDEAVLRNLAEEKGFTFETVPGNPQIAVQYGVKKQTAKFAIDKDGNIISRHDGVLEPEEWKELLESVQ